MAKAKKSRMGSDPLGWIKDSRKPNEEETEETIEEPTKKTIVEEKPKIQEKGSVEVAIPKEVESIPVSSIKKSGRPKVTREAENTSQMGLRNGWTRATFIIREDLLEKLKDMSYWDRRPIKEILDDIMIEYLESKPVEPRPKR